MNLKIAILWAALLPRIAPTAAELHVAVTGDDAHPGTPAVPLRTIQRAADLAQPGDTITVHTGVYRERVNPPRGGESDAKRIVYQAAPGEKVEIKGSEVVKGWTRAKGDVWTVTLPNSFFGDFNPFKDLIHGDWFRDQGRPHHTGAVYLNGEWLVEAAALDVGYVFSETAAAEPGKTGVLLNIASLRPSAGTEIPAPGYAAQAGVKNAPCSEGGECVGWIEPGDWIRYDGVDFGAGSDRIELRAASATTGGRVELRLDGPDGELIGTCLVPNTSGWQSWRSFAAPIRRVDGIRTLCLTFKAPPPPELGGPYWFSRADESNTTIWAQFKGVDPNKELVEINVRRTVFYPDTPGRNFITVRGFALRHAATPWAPPTAEQIGLIGTHWSKGWIIESNTISHSVCSGIALGKHGDEFDNTSANTAEGYVETIKRAHAHAIPWTRETIGHHIVRHNHVSHCEQAGIVGSLGCAFSTVTDNVIHDIHVRRLFTGAEMAGIKFHGAIDAEISRNHIYRTTRGLWLDWMAQGTRVSRNLFHDNGPREDLYMEVNHGPCVIDNNIFLSAISLSDWSQGGAYAHNLFAGKIVSRPELRRETPYHPPHSTAVAGLANISGGDNRFYNNLLLAPASLAEYATREFPSFLGGNAEYNETQASARLEGTRLHLNPGSPAQKIETRLVTTELLGAARIPNLPYVNPDGSPIAIDTDYFGKKRNPDTPTPGPFESPAAGTVGINLR